jgi:uncharacterized membrane protein
LRTAVVLAFIVALAACQRATEPALIPATDADATAPAHAGSGFMALGQEPGWRVDVRPGPPPGLSASLDYGNRRIEVTDLVVTETGWTGRAADGTPVSLEYLRRPCQDVMSGQPFEAEATLTVAGESWRGCGRFSAG